jgi:hypothetical protein
MSWSRHIRRLLTFSPNRPLAHGNRETLYDISFFVCFKQTLTIDHRPFSHWYREHNINAGQQKDKSWGCLWDTLAKAKERINKRMLRFSIFRMIKCSSESRASEKQQQEKSIGKWPIQNCFWSRIEVFCSPNNENVNFTFAFLSNSISAIVCSAKDNG